VSFISRRLSVAVAVVAAAFTLGGAALPAATVGTPVPPAPDRFVTDKAGLLAPDAAEQLNERLAAAERKTGHQVIVYVDRTTGGVPIEDWAVRAFAAWRIGRKGIDDGVALFLFTADRRVRIEVGYGLEPVVPDAVAARIIDEQMVPRLRAGDAAGAVRAGVESLLATIGGAEPSAAVPPVGPARPPGWVLIVGGLVALGLLGFLATHPSLAAWLIFTIGSGRGGGGGWGGGGGGGGFSGGGGRSGGGGASGSW